MKYSTAAVRRTEPTSSPGSSSRADLANLPSPPSSEFTFTAGRRLASLEQASTSDANTQPIPNLPYVFATNFSAATTLPAPTPQNQRTPPPTVVAPSPPTVPVQATPLPAAAAPTVPSTVTATPPTTTATPATEEIQCTASHADRKSLEDDCPICQEPLASTPLADLVWCKAQCGTNFHRECWAEWESSQLGSTSTGLPTLRCAFCRTSWPTPCHHDTSTPPAAIQPEPEPAADAAAAADDEEDDTFFPPSFFDPRSHAWSLWSAPSATTSTSSSSSSSSSPDHSSPLAALFDPARHTRPLLRDRRARADVFFGLPTATAAADTNDDDSEKARGAGERDGDGTQDDNDIAAALAALFNPRVHRRAQVFNCGSWETAEDEEEGGGGGGTGFDVLFDAKRHGRALRSERLARAAVLDADDDGEGGVLGALFEEEVCEVEEEEKLQQGGKGRELQMVYVTLVDDPGKEEEPEGGEDEEEQEEPTGLCERVAWWVCGRKWL
ncbi:hypothetical protein DBV05_g10076 [Lasiodiplodia theobromae]|uniref:RING-type domain-containing protein n=1 Tax=Lasiodiplodia theobromae TaxID=45133 RepID=A0A5N5D0T0_9PEZI|nr:hypothetical protein DBV05_g10076 [Lasiodiplodia theobromae]